MKTKWTEEQESAIITRGCNLLVAAAAGSGKTAVLVERIIRMIIDEKDPVDIDKLLVVTFTNAAASEMRERVGNAISKKLDENPGSMKLQRQLTLLNRSNITTMHSFCLDVVKNNFHYIDLDPNFRIADQTEIILMKQDILQDMFDEMYEENSEDFIRLVDTLGGKRDDRNVQELVENIYNFSMSGPSPKTWLRAKVEQLNLDNDVDLGNSMWVKILLNGTDEKLKSFIDDMENLKEVCKEENLNKAEENISETLSDLYMLKDYYNKSLDDFIKTLKDVRFSRLTIKGVHEDTKKEITDTRKSVKDSLAKLQKSINFTMKESKDAIKYMYPIMKTLSELIINFMDRFENKKREKGILDFNDLEHLCLRILNEGYSTGELIPSEVAIQLREKFDEVLVDEYQDSNNVQETIINLVSRKLTDKPNVFMVGDVKQSIYRFRQAKPELFLEKYNTYLKDQGKDRKILLYKNFRSREEVINSVNYIFKKVMSKAVGELEYTDEEALNLGAVYPKNEEESTIVGGPTEFHIIDMSGDKESESSSEDEIKLDEELDKVQIEARLVAKRIKELLNGKQKFKVFDKNLNDYRDIKYKDIVILLRATQNWADVFTEELASGDIPAYADASKGYFETIEVKTMISLLQIADNPLQDIPMISILRSPIFSFTPEELIDIRLFNKDKYFYEILEYIANEDMSNCKYESEYFLEETTKNKAALVVNSIKTWRNKALHMPIDEFVWYLYMDTHYYGYVGAMPNGIQRQANLRVFFQRAKQYEKTSFKGLFNFITFINKLKKSSGDMGSAKILGENENVVRIMSIHKSKGLEFPVVFLSGCGKQFNDLDLKGQILYHEELGFGPDYINSEENYKFPTIAKEAIKKKIKIENLSEEMRVLYVAFTRAREKLIITGTTKDLEKDCEKWSKAIGNNKVIPSSEVLSSNRYLDWIGLALINHNDGNILRELTSKDNYNIDENLSTFHIVKYDKSYVFVDKNNNNVEKILKEDKFISLDESMERLAYKNEINRRLNWEYEFKESSKIPSNISVSELKRTMFDDDEYNRTKSINDNNLDIIIKKPVFLQEKKGLSSAERGTAVHGVMQHMDILKCNTIKEIQSQLAFMVAKEFLTSEEISSVSPFKIQKFFECSIGKKIVEEYKKNPKNVNRETPFYIEISSKILNKNLPSQYDKEKTRVQGVIDCFIEEDDGIILIDYKTDYIDIKDKDWEKTIEKRYKVQIDYYTEAIERITGKKVKERYLYLFYLEKQLKI